MDALVQLQSGYLLFPKAKNYRVLILMVLVCHLMVLAGTKYFYGIDERTNNNYKILTCTYLYKLFIIFYYF